MARRPAQLGLATTNQGKLREFRDQLELLGFTLVQAPSDFDVDETGRTFAENALLKAQALVQRTGMSCIADDSGLVVDALHGAPGLYSARYSGTTDPARRDGANRARVLRELEHTPENKRQARFVCAIVYLAPGQSPMYFEGALEGSITREERGCDGFGYDAIFVPRAQTQTMAQLTREERYRLSHRALALAKLRLALMPQVDPAAAADNA